MLNHPETADARQLQTADLVIYGGNAGGVAAAVQGTRIGKTVLLIEPGNHIGGLTSPGPGATDIGNKGAIGGISREFYRRIRTRRRTSVQDVNYEALRERLLEDQQEPELKN